jgi:hypothetical protein
LAADAEFSQPKMESSEKLQGCLRQPDVYLPLWTKFVLMDIERTALHPCNKPTETEDTMGKETPVQSRQPRTIRFVQEDGALTISNPELAAGRTPGLIMRFPQDTPTVMHHLKGASRSSGPREGAPLSLLNPATVLKKLYELLEHYAPVWYTEENHNRAVAALAQTTRQ